MQHNNSIFYLFGIHVLSSLLDHCCTDNYRIGVNIICFFERAACFYSTPVVSLTCTASFYGGSPYFSHRRKLNTLNILLKPLPGNGLI